ncbi:ribonucleoside-triphosphate reductase, adenosylcobalamin-dependent [Actinopolyspora erythraea]|uniref:Adenosylcobalamin-dependent ribonucleoside-triphosphate reductase n=1 Tax=Actinopolyspora erythraea TaxID=414996 RepID=A0A223RRL7_9ACTN|nr:ribonucleoside-triphosphate reductase, adenosylcobalamin-dependent [Actinopolyspora erythraea]ASU78511.1 ribonucleoside-triphosphate reductase, adenosylcobalamin-dependent [Actinopolyspora erythraea]
MTNFGPTGELIYKRTYARTMPNGNKEDWEDTVKRVVEGNLNLVDSRYIDPGEREALIRMMLDFKIIPAGRHLWMSGIPGRQHLFNCHVSGWDEEDITKHFTFTLLRLAEGGGVGANYSNERLQNYSSLVNSHEVHIVCDPGHPDYEEMKANGVLSETYDSSWPGSVEVEDTREGWADALADLINAYYRATRNRNRVFDVSRVRWKGARLKSSGGHASGPEPLGIMLQEVSKILNSRVGSYLTGLDAMAIDHAIAKCVIAGGNRRSARMSIMHWEDPEIFSFISSKVDPEMHWSTNISVEIDDDFWAAVDDEDTHATDVLYEIVNGMLANGEPGFWNSSLSNVGEPNPIEATNPCGEIPLESWENCNLGHVNMAAFVEKEGFFYEEEVYKAHKLITRFLIRATYGDVNDSYQREVLDKNRRIGVGHLGVASMAAMGGEPYSALPETKFPRTLKRLQNAVNDEAARYAHQLRIPAPVKTTTVAPTGTVAKMPGVSEGIHPIFSKYFIRRIRFSMIDPDEFNAAMEYAEAGYTVEPCQYAANTLVVEIPTKDSLMEEVERRFGAEEAEKIVEGAGDLTLRDMMSVQAMYQDNWANNAVSYTANIDTNEITQADVTSLMKLYRRSLKGLTIFPNKSRPQSPYEEITKEEYDAHHVHDISDGIDENCASGACPVK